MADARPGSTPAINLNEPQRLAAQHGNGPLLIIAGAGTGKTQTLVHRVAHLIASGIDPNRILLLTFTRRAAAEMLRRVDALLSRSKSSAAAPGQGLAQRVWGGTFHAIATRLLRMDGQFVGLDPTFSILDRSDAEDLIDLVRTDMKLGQAKKSFPRKGSCMAIYSHGVNAQLTVEETLKKEFSWALQHADELKRMFREFIDRKEASSVLDYDDLLLFWRGLMADEEGGAKVRARFDAVLVDEYQDTNLLQADILKRLRPDGVGLTVVGDDAQSIYAFRAATIDNILKFPNNFPGATVIKLEQNYRSTQAILNVANQVIAQSKSQFEKQLWTQRKEGERPALVTCIDEHEQADYIISRVLELKEQGVPLAQQAVLFRSSNHSMMLEAELAAKSIPFVKYGGLKFLETAHVKDLLAVLRLAENPRDDVSGIRVLRLLPGVGPAAAKRLMEELKTAEGNLDAWKQSKVPAATAEEWPALVRLFERLRAQPRLSIPMQVNLARKFLEPKIEENYDHAEPRLRDLEQLEDLANRFADRREMLTEVALDPPTNTQTLAGVGPHEDDHLVLSTMHSAKGLEWKYVFVMNAADGCIPSSMSTQTREEVDEERRLFYVALTRAKDQLEVGFPLRHFQRGSNSMRDRHSLAQLTRFIDNDVRALFRLEVPRSAQPASREESAEDRAKKRQGIRHGVGLIED